MKKRLVIILVGLIAVLFLMAETDPFYKQMMEKGKVRYSGNQFLPALEHFRVAKFGLMMEKKLVKEIYLYQALCHFKLNQASQVHEILVQLKSEFNIKSISELDIPAEIQKDVASMRLVFEKDLIRKQHTHSLASDKNINLMKGFVATYQKALSFIEANQYNQAKIEIKKLKRINKKDIRIEYLLGRLGFEQKRYPDCIGSLRKVFRSGSIKLRSEALYYLVISYYFVKNFGQTLAFYQKIENAADRIKLETIIRKVRSERQQSINKLGVTFSKKGFKELIKRFEGDAFISRDLLAEALKKLPLQKPLIENILRAGQKNPQTCDVDFYLNGANYYEKSKKIKSAIAFLKKSRYYTSRKQENIDIFYKLGVFYFKMKNWQKSLIEMTKVKGIRQGYKDSGNYLETIKKLTQGG